MDGIRFKKKFEKYKGEFMTAEYWQQWDKDDLDSWQGKEIDAVKDLEEDGIDIQDYRLSKEEFEFLTGDYRFEHVM